MNKTVLFGKTLSVEDAVRSACANSSEGLRCAEGVAHFVEYEQNTISMWKMIGTASIAFGVVLLFISKVRSKK